MKLPSSYRFADEKIRDAFYALENGDDQEREIYKNIRQALNDIEENSFCGIQVPKKLIPKEYIQKYGVENAWKYNLPKGWRLIYSIAREEVIVISIILGSTTKSMKEGSGIENSLTTLSSTRR